jgi:hypothetical protein
MTVLSVSSRGATPAERVTTLQCDICWPPFVSTNLLRNLLDQGWLTTLEGEPFDVCSVCSRRRSRSQLVPRKVAVAKHMYPPGAMPNFVIIGAAKCGTTSLHAYLAGHPDIGMSTVKEPYYFNDPDHELWRPYYESLFAPDRPLRGEASTVYTRAPAVPGVADRMAAVIPDAKLIYLVRDPVERALASFVEESMHDNERRTADEAFADLDDPINPYVAASRYAYQLGLYLDAFEDPRWMVVEMDELRTSPDGVLRRICEFLGAEPLTLTGQQQLLNTRETKRAYPDLVRRIRGSGVLHTVYRLPPGPREALLRPVRRLLAQPISPPQLSPRLRQALADQLRPDIERFRDLTGQRFADWPV